MSLNIDLFQVMKPFWDINKVYECLICEKSNYYNLNKIGYILFINNSSHPFHFSSLAPLVKQFDFNYGQQWSVDANLLYESIFETYV